MDETLSALPTGILIYFIQKWLKQRSWYAEFVKVLPGAAKWAHRLVALVGALIGALGIHWAWEGSASVGWHLSVAIPNLSSLAHAAWDVLKIYLFQQWAYDSGKQLPWAPPPEVKP